MDFKITGTDTGITAIQLDTKTIGLDKEIIKETLARGKKARLEILEVMNKAISESRKELSKYAPRITTFKIDPEKIREVIGSGGKVINEIIATCEVAIDINDEGQVFVCGVDPLKTEEAVNWIKNIAKKFEVGEIITGKIVRMLDFGIFVQLTPNRDGMVHVSEMAPYRVSRPDGFVNVGDTVTVKIKEIDEQNRINLTMKGLAENEPLWKDEKGKDNGNGFNNRNGDDRQKSRFNNRDKR
jgi:polyribonucleotide nucleotidyltransferase